MSYRFRVLGSGSSGNSALLETNESRILIDAGFSARKLEQLLAEAGSSLAHIDAIFLTHEHGDHAAGIDGLRKHPNIQVFANEATARNVQEGLKFRPAWQIFQTGSRFRFKDLEVTSFSIPHDARDPVGYRIDIGHADDLFSPRRSLAWVTDLGHAPENVRQHMGDCEVLVLEANYCPKLLQADTKRPWPTKQRISGRHGHLSNQAMAELLESISSPRWRHIFLAHLSKDCNSIDAVEETLAPLRPKLNCQFNIIPAGEGFAPVEL